MFNKKFTILKALLILLAVVIISASKNVVAQENQLQPVSCFGEGMYKFQSVSVVLGTQDMIYGKSFSAGDVIDFEGYLKNENPYPVVDGYVYARISSSNDEYLTEGFNIVDEFFVAEKISIDANSQEPLSFSWQAPENLQFDSYRVDYYFSVDKRFNLGGLSFTNEITAGETTLQIEGVEEKTFYLDRTETKVNDKKYLHIGGWPYLKSGESFVATQPIQNLTSEKLDVNVKYEFYYWDSIKNENLIDTKNETITIDPQSETILKYENNNLNTSVGYLKITTEAKGLKSIINIRFSTELNNTRLNYAAVSQFPLSKDDQFKVFTCAYNTVGGSTGNTISLKLIDKKGKIISEKEYQTDLSTSIDGYAMDLVANDDYQFLTLETSVKDTDGSVLTSYKVDYDCSVLNSEKCVEKLIEEYDSNILLYSITAILILFILLVAILVSRKTKKTNTTLTSILLLGLVVSSAYLVSNLVYKTNVADAVLTGLDGTYKTARSMSTGNWVGWSGRELAKDLTIDRFMQGIIYTPYEQFDKNSAEIGDIFYVGVSSMCDFYQTGGRWNTPNCGQEQLIIDSANGNTGKIIMSRIPYRTSINPSNSKVECVIANSGNMNDEIIRATGDYTPYSVTGSYTTYKCTIKDSGSFSISASIDGGNSTLYACANIGGDDVTRVSNNNLNNNNPYCASNYPNPLINAGTYDNLIGFNSNPDDKTRYLEGTTFTWDFFVNNRNPIGYHDSSSCDVSTGWTCDEGNFSEHILVDFWEGNDPNNLNYIGQTVANLESEVGVNNACGGTSAHRFRFPTPAAAKTGAETSIYAFGINIGAGNNVLLTESPKTINCAPDPIDGECNTNTTNYYYPQISDIDTNELCNTSGGSTGPTSNGDGTFSWTCLGEHEGDNVSCNTKNLDPDLSVICRFEPYELLSTLELQDNLKVQTYVQGSSLDTNELRYMFVNNDSDLVYEPANGGLSVEGDNYNSWSDKNFLNLKLNQHGVYQIRSYVEYFGEELANDVCEGNFDDHLITLGLPEISFSIDPELANDNNQCQAEISISNELSDQEVECKIVTNEGDVVYDGNDLVNGFNGIIEVTAGTSYKLKCELSDARYSSLNNNGALDDLLETELDRCLVNPDFRQN